MYFADRMPLTINLGGELIDFDTPWVMGILNATDDSFYAHSRCVDDEAIAARVSQMVAEGADVIDVGACSTRPGSAPVTAEQEELRLCRALEVIRDRYPAVRLSIDTYRASVVRAATKRFGAMIINDISAGSMDDALFEAVAEAQMPYILSHIKGTPATMASHAHYDDLMGEVVLFLSERLARLRQMGVCDVMIDPGFGFAKTLDHNYELLAHLDELALMEAPIVVGVSRKRMIYQPLGITPEESLNGTTVLHTIALIKGASILRVHDVRAARECVALALRTLA